MPELADIFLRYGYDYYKEYGERILKRHTKAILDISRCRTKESGGHVKKCNKCHHIRYVYHSCCNRSCPKCQGRSIKQWLGKRETELLPVTYYHIVFTVPQEIRYIIRSNQQKLLSILMKTASLSLKKLAADPKYVGGKISILTLLHTWTRALIYHPHVHCLVPGGGLSFDKQHWIFPHRSFLLPVRALSKVFRAIFVEMARKELPDIVFPQSIWKKQWVVYCKPSVQGAENIIKYLARYVYKVAITNNRIISDTNGKVSFRYKDSRDNRWKIMTLESKEFIRRFLQHVPLKRFHKVRFYGLLSPNQKQLILKIRLQMKFVQKMASLKMNESAKEEDSTSEDDEKSRDVCPKCQKGKLITVFRFPSNKILFWRRPPP